MPTPRVDVPPVVRAVTALWAALLLGASLLWPVGYGLDEFQHIDMAYAYSHAPFHFYAPGGRAPSVAANALGAQRHAPPQDLAFGDRLIAARSQRPSLEQLGGNAPAKNTLLPNQMTQHPPLYYELAGAVLWLPGVSGMAWDVQTWLMRLVSVLFMLPVPALCFAAARRLLREGALGGSVGEVLEKPERLAVLAAVVPLTIPNLIRDGSAVTNDSLLILTTSVVLYLLCRIVTGDLSRKVAIWLAVSLAAALLTKGFSLVLPPFVLAAYVIGCRRAGKPLTTLVPPLGVAAVGGAIGGLWWLHNVVAYGAVQTNGFGPNHPFPYGTSPGGTAHFTTFLKTFLYDFVSRIWGETGYPDNPSPGNLLIFGWFTLLLLGAAGALLFRRETRSRSVMSLLVLLPLANVAVVAQGSWSTYRVYPDTPHGSQGRYLFQTVVALAVVATVGWLNLVRPQVACWLAPATFAGALLTNGLVWERIVSGWYEKHEGGSFTGGLHSVLAWSPLPSPLTLLVFCLPVLLAVVAGRAVIVNARQLDSPTPRPSEHGALQIA
ncbi:MAG: hypothetical protein WCD35_16380 [Mycobacteriales bacterium]